MVEERGLTMRPRPIEFASPIEGLNLPPRPYPTTLLSSTDRDSGHHQSAGGAPRGGRLEVPHGSGAACGVLRRSR